MQPEGSASCTHAKLRSFQVPEHHLLEMRMAEAKKEGREGSHRSARAPALSPTPSPAATGSGGPTPNVRGRKGALLGHGCERRRPWGDESVSPPRGRKDAQFLAWGPPKISPSSGLGYFHLLVYSLSARLVGP